MPFSKETASNAGKLSNGLRWRDKDPDTVRNRQIKITVSDSERDAIEDKAAMTGLSMTELIIKAVKAYKVR